MKTPIPTKSSLDRVSISVRVVVVLACLLLMVPAAGAQPLSQTQDDPTVPAAQPLGEFVGTSGTLTPPAGRAMRFNPCGYRLSGGQGEAPRVAATVPGNENWIDGISTNIPGTDGAVYAFAVDTNGAVFVAGNFIVAGHLITNHVAKWDGSAWSALGSGLNGAVYALALDGAGNLYAGGRFTTAGSVEVNSVARWDGNTWSSLGSGMGGDAAPCVYALAVDAAGNLYAGGYFWTAGGIDAFSVAKWDGSAWSPVGSGVGGGYDVYVAALTIDMAGNLYAGGTFTLAGGVGANYVAKWDGSSWSPLGSGMGQCSGYDVCVSALAVDATGNLYAGGDFRMAGGVYANRVARWDGSTWSILGSGMYDSVEALAVDAAGNLYAGGNFTNAGGVSARNIAKWDGTTWSALGSGMNHWVHALALDAAGYLYAGGWFTTAGGAGVSHIARWTGSTWFPLGSGTNGEVAALAIDTLGNLYVGGSFTTIEGVGANHIAMWDGTAWSALGSGVSGGYDPYVSTLALDAAGNLYAGGTFITAGGVSANYVARWDGSAWSSLGSGLNSSVHALAIDSAGNLYAGGWFTTAGDVHANHIARWDGSSWSALGSGMGGGYETYVHVLAIGANDDVFAGGPFTTAGGVTAEHVARWDGSTWSPVGNGIQVTCPYSQCVSALKVDMLGGLYAASNSVYDSQMYRWNGIDWSSFSTLMGCDPYGYGCTVNALAIDEAGILYAGGEFSGVDGVTTNYIAKWNGSTWSALGSGIGGYWPFVNSLAVDAAGNLYAGGDFATAGNHVAAYLARWTAADGVRGVTAGSYTFYTNNLPVTIRVVTPGTLDQLTVQRVNRSHSQASPDLDTGYYWEIAGTDTNGNPATGYVVDLTLPTTFTPATGDQVCRYAAGTWDCAASAYTANSITRTGITGLSDWAVAYRSGLTPTPTPTNTPSPTPTATVQPARPVYLPLIWR